MSLCTVARTLTLAAAALLPLSPSLHAQMDDMKPASGKPLLSPAATATTPLGNGTVTIKYNSPSIRGRKIMGGLVPYGQVWRTGANPATTLITTTDVTIGDLGVPAGTYTIYTLPSEEKWLFIVNKQTGQWGTVYNQPQDLGRVPMSPATMTTSQEHMTISFEKTTKTSTQLHVRWETTDRYVTLKTR